MHYLYFDFADPLDRYWADGSPFNKFASLSIENNFQSLLKVPSMSDMAIKMMQNWEPFAELSTKNQHHGQNPMAQKGFLIGSKNNLIMSDKNEENKSYKVHVSGVTSNKKYDPIINEQNNPLSNFPMAFKHSLIEGANDPLIGGNEKEFLNDTATSTNPFIRTAKQGPLGKFFSNYNPFVDEINEDKENKSSNSQSTTASSFNPFIGEQ